MPVALKDKLKEMLYEKRLTAIQVEKMAGLKGYGVRNILLGRSQNPSVVTVKAIADVLGCSVEELLGGDPPSALPHKVEHPHAEKTPLSSVPIESPSLFIDATILVMTLAQDAGKILNTAQASKIIKEVYVFALKKNLKTPDKDFAEWLIESQIGEE